MPRGDNRDEGGDKGLHFTYEIEGGDTAVRRSPRQKLRLCNGKDESGRANRPGGSHYNEGDMEHRAVVADPDILEGLACFAGTRVPFQNLMDYLEGGHSLDEFLRQFPTVSREKAIQALEETKESLLASIV